MSDPRIRHEWRIRCQRKPGPFYRVLIFATKEEMRAWAHEHDTQRRRMFFHSCEAGVHSYRSYRRMVGRRWRTPESGWIVFYLGNIGAGIVAHEMLHVAMHYLVFWRPRLKQFTVGGKVEELLAWTEGWLVRQFWVKFFRAYPEKKPRVSHD